MAGLLTARLASSSIECYVTTLLKVGPSIGLPRTLLMDEQVICIIDKLSRRQGYGTASAITIYGP
jgi:hypothetical protein